MKIGDKLDWFLDLEADGHKIKELDNYPVLSSMETYYFKIFRVISARRQVGMTANKILISEITSYVDFLRIDDMSERIWIFSLVTNLDDHWMEHVSKANSDT